VFVILSLMRCYAIRSYNDKSTIDEYSFSQWKVTKSRVYESITSICDRVSQWDTLLLDWDFFDWYITTFKRYASKPVAILDLKKKLNDVVAQFKVDHWIKSDYYAMLIDEVIVNGEQANDIVWQMGTIECTMTLVFIHKHAVSSKHVSKWRQQQIKVMPQNLHTLHWIKTAMRKQNFHVLYVYDEQSQLFSVKEWTLVGYQKINFGVHHLRELAVENHVWHLLWSFSWARVNQMWSEIIWEVFDVFSATVTKRAISQIGLWQDMYVVSNLLDHEVFMQKIEKNYQTNWWWFAVPLHPFAAMWPRDRKHDEADISIWWNHYFGKQERPILERSNLFSHL
jgi:hypothetical protein